MSFSLIVSILIVFFVIGYFTLGGKNIQGLIMICVMGATLLFGYLIWTNSALSLRAKSSKAEETALRMRLSLLEKEVKDRITQCHMHNFNPERLVECIDNIRSIYAPELTDLKVKVDLILERKAKRKALLRLLSNLASIGILIYVGFLTYEAWKAKPSTIEEESSNNNDEDIPESDDYSEIDDLYEKL